MFTGIVEALGTVEAIEQGRGSAMLYIDAAGVGGPVRIGDSLAVNGCCLTVTKISNSTMCFEAVPETLSRTNLGQLSRGDTVNLERAVKAGEPLGGHFVQGHIDCTGKVDSLISEGDSKRVRVLIPEQFARYVVPKGSIALDGVSLTVTSCGDNFLEVVLVPHTIKVTTLGLWEAGYSPNVEFDILAKYVERMLFTLEKKTHT